MNSAVSDLNPHARRPLDVDAPLLAERAGKGDLNIVDGYVGEVLIEPSRAEQSRHASMQPYRAMSDRAPRCPCASWCRSSPRRTLECPVRP